MQYALDIANARVSADAAKNLPRATYRCPVCEGAVRLRAGTQRIAHYSHVSKKECDSFAHEMTPWHLGWQALFPEDCREYVLEANGEKHRTDVLYKNIAIEFQHSPISETEFWRRCDFYTKATRHLVWVFDVRERWAAERIEELGGSAGEENYRWRGHRPTFCGFRPKSQPRITLVLQFEGTDAGEGIDLCEVTNVAGEPEFSYFESYESRIDEHPFPEWIDTILIPKLDRAAVPLSPIVPNIVTHRRTKAEMDGERSIADEPESESTVSAPPISQTEESPSSTSAQPEESPVVPETVPVATTPTVRSKPPSRFPPDKCPECGGDMVLHDGKWVDDFLHAFRRKKLPPYWTCSRYGCPGFVVETNPPKCPKCGETMVVRSRWASRETFWGCPKFPNCNGYRPGIRKS